MVDTCQAQSMHQEFYSPNILAVGSSKVGEDSLSVSQVLVKPTSVLLGRSVRSKLLSFIDI